MKSSSSEWLRSRSSLFVKIYNLTNVGLIAPVCKLNVDPLDRSVFCCHGVIGSSLKNFIVSPFVVRFWGLLDL